MVVFLPGQGGTFTSGAHGQNTGDAILNLKVGQTGKPCFIDRVAVERRYDGGITSWVHVTS